jgi:hypothetical protein
LVQKFKGKRPPGKHRHRGKDIKTDNNETTRRVCTGFIWLITGTSDRLL